MTALLLGAPAIVAAQVSPPQPLAPESAPRFRVGTLRLDPTFAVTNVGVDSNVFNTPEFGSADFTATISPATNGWWNVRRVRTLFRGQVDLVYFKTFASERSVDGGLAGRVELGLNRITPWTEIASYSGRQRVGYEINERTRRSRTDLSLGTMAQVGSKTTVDLGLRRTVTDWSGNENAVGPNLREFLARTTSSVNVVYTQRLTVLTAVVVEASAGRDRFEFAPFRDTDMVSAVAGFDLKPRALISGSARVGYKKADPVGGEMTAFRGFVARVSTGYNLGTRARVLVDANRDMEYSFEPLYPYYVLTGAAVTLRQRVGGPWDVESNIGRQGLAYSLVPGSGLAARSDRVIQLGIGVGFNLSTGMRVGWNLYRMTRESPLPQRDYRGYRIGTSLTYTP